MSLPIEKGLKHKNGDPVGRVSKEEGECDSKNVCSSSFESNVRVLDKQGSVQKVVQGTR